VGTRGCSFINARLAVTLHLLPCTRGFTSLLCKGITLQLKVASYKRLLFDKSDVDIHMIHMQPVPNPSLSIWKFGTIFNQPQDYEE